MTLLDLILKRRERLTAYGAPEGRDAQIVAELAATPWKPPGADRTTYRDIIHVSRDDARMARMAESLEFFAPEIPVLTLPAWDCLPYDRVSPSSDLAGRRVACLAKLATGGRRTEGERTGSLVLLTTVASLMQRTPPANFWIARRAAHAVGEEVAPDALIATLDRAGFTRSETVGEIGEYAVRGGILDVFPPSADEPLRLDFFGDVLDGIRRFDPLSQISNEKTDRIEIAPVSEISLDTDSIERFRSGYRARFGAGGGADPLYEAVSAGRRFSGMEQWLPLFHERLVALFDYLPGAVTVLDHRFDEAWRARADLISDYFQIRSGMDASGADAESPSYNPLPPDLLYLGPQDWSETVEGARALALQPYSFEPPDGEAPPADIVDLGARIGVNFAEARAKPDGNPFDALRVHAEGEAKSGRRVLIATHSIGTRERLASVLAEHEMEACAPVDSLAELEALPQGSIGLAVLSADAGFVGENIAVITEQDLLGERLTRTAKRKRKADNFLRDLASISDGDFVVHVDHGIGRYAGLETINVGGAPHDCLRIEYDGGDKLFVPVENMDVLSRFGGTDAPLDRLGGAGWQARKARVKNRLRDMADELIKIAAERQARDADRLEPAQGLYDEFAARFPYPETEDQIGAIDDVLEDLASGRPMDRLVCGDVGFGKTEVALRAAFVAAMSGRQAAVVVPTTLLCRQHHKTFTERFQGLPIHIGQLSRFVTAKDANGIKAGLKDGTTDVVVGTHALLGKGVDFKDLALLIVDEEQHFGVRQKERLKQLKSEVHVLTLTATPIPRTLQLAMSGIREMSIIATPPVDRLAVRTYVTPYDPAMAREAILREHYRGGQTFYVCPRIEDIAGLQERLTKLVPEVKLAVAHGQMVSSELDATMNAFYDRRFDVLLSTNIVESGLDVPTANTMIIHRADMFGLSQLYQLRGRIGRSKQRAYAYLTTPTDKKLTESARRRLHVMQTLDTLGAGFTLASHDMDIRGAGNILGEEQHGQIKEVGIELYQSMLEEAVAAARVGGALGAGPEAEMETTAAQDSWTPQISLGAPVLIPEDYVADLGIRLGLYKRVAGLVDKREIDAFAAELIDRFGGLPPEVENLLRVVEIKRLCKAAGVDKIDAGPKGAVVSFHNDNFARPEQLLGFIQRQAGTMKLRPDHKLVYRRVWEDQKRRMKGVYGLLKKLAALAA